MKYIVVLADGMADEPISKLDGMTPMEYARTPAMDELASKGVMGLVRTVPASMKPGSDVANLAVLGYDPTENYTGRSPLEALSVGVPMDSDDVVFRCNLVTLSDDDEYENKKILDHSAGEITTQEADELMDTIRAAFNSDTISFYTGTSYRQIAVWKGGEVLELEQPHDHLGEVIDPFLPEYPLFREMMKKSFTILDQHPINRRRAEQGKNKANSLWFWGAGTKPSLQNFHDKTGLHGTMISAVDLLKGIAKGVGMQVVEVEGATGSLDTNYTGKANAAIRALLEEGQDFVYLHVEAPDEMGHQGNMQHKVQAIEFIDSEVVAAIKAAMDCSGEPYRMLVLPDHPTPIRCRTHTSDPVPFVLYDSEKQRRGLARFSEKEASATGVFEPNGHKLLDLLINKYQAGM